MTEDQATRFGAWVLAAASVRGPVHVRKEMPNQDAWAAGAGSDGIALAAAVADGHGARIHARSDVGARLATGAALACLAAPGSAADLPSRIAATWRELVLAHRAENPMDEMDDWTEDEAELTLAYGTTLIAAQLRDNALLALQIGDGNLLVGLPDGTIRAPLPDDEGIEGEATHSMCEPQAAARFRLAQLGAPADLADVARHFRSQAQAGRIDQIAASLPDWLANVAARGAGDDATLLLAYLDQPTG
jgi:hypothetical protein